MDEKGLSEEEVFEELNCFSNSDSNFRKVLSSMCTIPHPIAVKSYNQFIHSNIGDPGLFCGTAEMEKQIIKMIADILNHPNPKDAYGHLTSGGTESNVEAVLHMKNRYMVFHNDNDSGGSSCNHSVMLFQKN
jgi:Glutamate decarboxylase and related PLP-dependent proteins